MNHETLWTSFFPYLVSNILNGGRGGGYYVYTVNWLGSKIIDYSPDIYAKAATEPSVPTHYLTHVQHIYNTATLYDLRPALCTFTWE